MVFVQTVTGLTNAWLEVMMINLIALLQLKVSSLWELSFKSHLEFLLQRCVASFHNQPALLTGIDEFACPGRATCWDVLRNWMFLQLFAPMSDGEIFLHLCG